jgi:hypothetical protein
MPARRDWMMTAKGDVRDGNGGEAALIGPANKFFQGDEQQQQGQAGNYLWHDQRSRNHAAE